VKRWKTNGWEIVPQGREGVLKQEESSCTEKLTHRPKGGAVESWKTGQNKDLESRKQRKLHVSAHKQLTDCGSDKGTERSPQKPGC